MRTRIRVVIVGGALAALLAMSVTAQAAPTKATCSDVGFLGIVVHGQHVVRDYVVGHDAEDPVTSWPPAGQVDASGGAAIPGGPGRGHLGADIAPGASFCTDSSSPGLHL